MRCALAAAALVAVGGCAGPAPEPAAEAPAATVLPPRIENRVWARVDSAGAPTGELYAFLGQGTLVIASTTGTPLLGTWTRDGDGLRLVEEGTGHDTEILRLDHGELLLRSHHPGGTPELRLVPADTSLP